MLGEDGKIKLCDFGSVTMEVVSPDENWSAQRRALLEDDVSYLKNVNIYIPLGFISRIILSSRLLFVVGKIYYSHVPSS